MNIPSVKLDLEMSTVDGRHVVRYKIDHGIGGVYPESYRVITGENELHKFFEKLADDILNR